MDQTTLDQLCVNTIRFLSADAVQKANSGHPGAPMGAAPMAYTLWDRFLKHNPANPGWTDRDRFVLSPGHASMLLYSLLHLTGYDLPLEEIENFRQWAGKTPGHPEFGDTPGVEMTTGPLGQGFAHGVGMAISERHLAARFNTPDNAVVDHFTYGIVSDGDLQEGVSSEAASLAGTLGVGKLIYLYDSNSIQIEGSTDVVFTENVADRFAAYGWQVIGPIDGNDVEAIDAAIREAQSDSERPSLIICRTIIGYGSPAQGTAKTHGEPLGEAGLSSAKATLGWPQEPRFHVPDEAAAHMRKALERGSKYEAEWNSQMEQYSARNPKRAIQFLNRMNGELPDGWDTDLVSLFGPDTKPIATRSASGKVLNAIAPRIEALMGGSADLAPSNKTLLADESDFSKANPAGRNMHFGVREHAMAAIAGGMALHGGMIPYVATFLTFSDYMRPSIRLAALMSLRVVYVFTHDSIGLGEDGPTHQPVEHLMALRAIPKLTVIRPGDATETTVAWKTALENTHGPTALILTRQNLPVIDRTKHAAASESAKGGYVLWSSSDSKPDVILIGTGSEVSIALDAGRQLAADGINVRVVSMPSWETFDAQPSAYRDLVLPSAITARVAVEAGLRQGWERYVGLNGAVMGLDSFGASAPAAVLYEKFGITAARVVEEALSLLRKNSRPTVPVT